MRSSKSRSRNKSNRNRPSGNIVNRVFDSSGPEGKVRGTPQQIIDKYNQLARDAQLGNDRVATENFQQHAEHYLRMLNEAQREQDTRREEQERVNRERQAERDRERRARMDRQEREANGNDGEQPDLVIDPSERDQPDVIVDAPESGLVETPENRAEEEPSKSTRKPSTRKRSSSSPRRKKSDEDAPAAAEAASTPEGGAAAE